MKIINCWSNTSDGRFDLLDEEADIYVMNYESYKIVRNKIMKSNFDCMIVDESSCMKNMKSQITSMILGMINVIPHRFVLSGTPAPNRFDEFFPQMKFVNPDIFGNNKYGFLQTYSHQSMKDPHVWYQTDEDKDKFNARLTEQAVFLKKKIVLIFRKRYFKYGALKWQVSKGSITMNC